ncbi:ATP-binding protein [Streptomyces sp. NBC_01296]|uniref:ATP-binding protein n=1 Tax=Streptomyces sp. NBC_01296 TaxID=2903816 RepID=UPI003FA38155
MRAARLWTAGHLASLSWDESAEDTVHSVLLSVSELVANAHLHAAGTAHLVLTWDGRCLHVSVADSDPRLPGPRPADADATSGRGLGIVTTLADSWDIHACHGGKAITACFRPHGGADPRTGPPADGGGPRRS